VQSGVLGVKRSDESEIRRPDHIAADEQSDIGEGRSDHGGLAMVQPRQDADRSRCVDEQTCGEQKGGSRHPMPLGRADPVDVPLADHRDGSGDEAGDCDSGDRSEFGTCWAMPHRQGRHRESAARGSVAEHHHEKPPSKPASTPVRAIVGHALALRSPSQDPARPPAGRVSRGVVRVDAYGLRMSDPKPDSPPETADPDGAPVENPSGLTTDDATGPGEPLEINPDLPLIDPAGE
jgi:hypothetical protein